MQVMTDPFPSSPAGEKHPTAVIDRSLAPVAGREGGPDFSYAQRVAQVPCGISSNRKQTQKMLNKFILGILDGQFLFQ